MWVKKNIHTIFNWGNGRIPDAGDLDVGTGEFFPNEKYKKFRWNNFKKYSS